MPKFIGAAATAAAAANPPLNDQGRINGQVRRLAHDSWNGDAAQNDTVSLGFVDWDTLMDPTLSTLAFDDFGTGVNLDVGDVTYPAALTSGQDISSAAGSINPLRSVSIANRRRPLWQMLGYASLAAARAVGPRAELLATFKDGNPGVGTLAWTLYGSAQ